MSATFCKKRIQLPRTTDEKPAPSVRELQVDDVDESILERMEKGVLYRVRK